jgi:hypothetical protein
LYEEVEEIATTDSRRFMPKGEAWRTAFSMTLVGVGTFRPFVQRHTFQTKRCFRNHLSCISGIQLFGSLSRLLQADHENDSGLYSQLTSEAPPNQ